MNINAAPSENHRKATAIMKQLMWQSNSNTIRNSHSLILWIDLKHFKPIIVSLCHGILVRRATFHKMSISPFGYSNPFNHTLNFTIEFILRSACLLTCKDYAYTFALAYTRTHTHTMHCTREIANVLLAKVLWSKTCKRELVGWLFKNERKLNWQVLIWPLVLFLVHVWKLLAVVN